MGEQQPGGGEGDEADQQAEERATPGLVAGEAALLSVVQDGGAAGALSYAEVARNGTPSAPNSMVLLPV